MGVRAGLDMINQLRHIEAILIDDQNEIHTSENIHTHLKKKQQ
jgi:thiamine biosynthesis lipoprotein